MRQLSASVLALALLSACGDDQQPVPTADGGVGRDGGATRPDAAITGDGGAPAGDGGGGVDAGIPSGDPCAEGAISTECVCAGALHVSGYCCNGLWFDPVYETLTGGCPAASAYRYVDPAHAMASDSGPGTEAMPWATIEHGVATIDAGQVLVVRAGTYGVQGTGSRYTPALSPAHSGTAGSPVVIKADGAVVITSAPFARGTARGGSAGNIVLADAASSEDNAYEGAFVRIVEGTGAGQSRWILRAFDRAHDATFPAYEGATRTAWVSGDPEGHGNWTTPPDATSVYELVRQGPLAGTLDRDHVVWDGFHVVERDSYAPDTGPVVLWGSRDVALLHCDVEAAPVLLYDNHNALRINNTDRALVRGNRLHGVMPVEIGHNNPQNHAAIMIYLSSYLTIEHNEVFGSYTGVFPKGGVGHDVIRYNFVHDVTKGFRFSYHEDMQVYGNVVRDASMAFQGAENNTGIRIFNNTVHRSMSGLNNWFGIDGVDVFGNVFSEVPHPVDLEGAPGSFTMHHNAYHAIDDFVVGSRGVGGFAAWQGRGYDVGSIVVDTPFVDAAGGDYHLVAGSPARTAGVDFEDLDGDGDRAEAIPMGAFVTGTETIGPVR